MRFGEALLERFAMSPVGYQFIMHVAPRIDKVLIPRTKGRLSSIDSAWWGWSRPPAPSRDSRVRIR